MRLVLLTIAVLPLIGCGQSETKDDAVVSAAEVTEAFADQHIGLAVDVSAPSGGNSVIQQILAPHTESGRAVRAVYVLRDSRTAANTGARLSPRTLKRLDSRVLVFNNVLVVIDPNATEQAMAGVRAALNDLKGGADD